MIDHDLLIRIDERLTELMDEDMPEIKKGLQEMSTSVAEHQVLLKVQEERWKWIKRIVIPVAGGGGASGLGALIKSLLGG